MGRVQRSARWGQWMGVWTRRQKPGKPATGNPDWVATGASTPLHAPPSTLPLAPKPASFDAPPHGSHAPLEPLREADTPLTLECDALLGNSRARYVYTDHGTIGAFIELMQTSSTRPLPERK
jgi:hypothetical protein